MTGSKTLLQTGGHSVLVDCGLFQGLKDLRLRNWGPPPLDPSRVDAIVLTHAHLDHSGYLPVLAKGGFRGPIFGSQPTLALTKLILMDSAKLQEEDADFANRHGYSKHQPAKPLYDQKDVARVLDLFRPTPAGKWTSLPGGEFRLTPSGHILGSTFVELEVENNRFVFSGDLGRGKPLLYDPPSQIESADYLVLESTYGDRIHRETPEESREKLGRIVTETVARGGQVIVPSFAIGRVQELLYMLSTLRRERKIPDVPVYLDSPMGTAATGIFGDFPSWHHLATPEVDRMFRETTVLESRADSIRVMREAQPAVVIAGSGMMTGGRVLHHVEARLADPRNTILLVGYQAVGTRGRLLDDGVAELKMHGKYLPVSCAVERLEGLSAHADQFETLNWLAGFRSPPKRTFINHGEPQAADALRLKITDRFGWVCDIPKLDQSFSIDPVETNA